MNTTRWPHSRTPHQRNGGAGGVADEVQSGHGDRSACFEVPPVAQASRTFAHFRQMRIQRHRPFAPDSRHSGKAVAVRKSHDTIVILVPFSLDTMLANGADTVHRLPETGLRIPPPPWPINLRVWRYSDRQRQ
jgi:hypothetical protein